MSFAMDDFDVPQEEYMYPPEPEPEQEPEAEAAASSSSYEAHDQFDDWDDMYDAPPDVEPIPEASRAEQARQREEEKEAKRQAEREAKEAQKIRRVQQLPDDLKWHHNTLYSPDDAADFCFLCEYTTNSRIVANHDAVGRVRDHIYSFYETTEIQTLCRQVQEQYDQNIRPHLPERGRPHRNEWKLATIAKHIEQHDKSELMTLMVMVNKIKRQIQEVSQHEVYYVSVQAGVKVGQGVRPAGAKMQMELMRLWSSMQTRLNTLLAARVAGSSSSSSSSSSATTSSSSALHARQRQGVKRGWHRRS